MRSAQKVSSVHVRSQKRPIWTASANISRLGSPNCSSSVPGTFFHIIISAEILRLMSQLFQPHTAARALYKTVCDDELDSAHYTHRGECVLLNHYACVQINWEKGPPLIATSLHNVAATRESESWEAIKLYNEITTNTPCGCWELLLYCFILSTTAGVLPRRALISGPLLQ